MLKAIGEYVGGKVLTAVLVVISAAGIIWFYKHPEQWDALWSVIGRLAAWLGIMAVLPWAGFPAQKWVVRKDSNLAGAALLGLYLAGDVAAALLLAGGGGHGVLAWMVFILGFLAAAVYNFVVCDFQVTRMEEAGGF